MQKENIKTNSKTKIQAELKRLRKELAKVKLERNILEKFAGCLQASIRIKFEFINQHISCFPAKDICKILDVSTSDYYKWRGRVLSTRAMYNQVLIEEITKIHYRNRKRYGNQSITKELEASGFHTSEKLVRKLKKQASLQIP